VGTRIVVRQVDDEDSERLRYLKSLGLVPMVVATVLKREPFGGPITVRVEDGDTFERVIGPELAAFLLVERRP
jgi:DtxR family Mn-dependent transcriptional regulator